MERNGDSREQNVCKRVFFSLIMLLMGLVFCFILTILSYFTYQTIAGDRAYCSLWIDIPGRMAIYLICFYVACLCGYFPIPRCYRPWWFPEAFILWKYESWINLFRILCIPTPSADLIRRLRRTAQNRRDSDTLPLYHARYQMFYNVAPTVAITRRRSAPVHINPKDDLKSVDNYSSEAGKYRSTTEDENINEVFQSFDSPEYGGFIPMVTAEESSRPRFQSDTTVNRATSFKIKEQEQGIVRQEQGIVRQERGIVRQERGIVRQEQGTLRQEQQENEAEDRPRNFPRIPWGFLRNPGCIPPIANKLHLKNLQREKRERLIYKKKLKAEKLKALKKAESNGKVTLDASDTVERITTSEHTKEPTPSDGSKVRESGEHLTDKVNVDAIEDKSTSTKNETKDDRKEGTHKEIDSKKSEKIVVPYITTGTRRRLLISQKNPQQSIVRSRRQKSDVKCIDDLEASRLEIRKSTSAHRRTHSEVGSPGMSERSSTQAKQDKDTKFEEQLLIAQAQDESTQLWLRVREYTGTSREVPRNSEFARNTDLGTQRQLNLTTTSSQKTEESDAGDLPIPTSKQRDKN